MTSDLRLALGPVPYYWPRELLCAFYAAMAEAPVAVVYLGEQVCSRRHEMRLEDWLEIADRLAAHGKEVVLSSQALLESEGDLKLLRRVVENGRYRVEANDMSAVRLLSGQACWVAGPHLNIYNPQTLGLFAELGATRWAAPIEVTRQVLAGVLASRPAGVEAEVFAYGRLPLAFSARCFTARRFNLQKENCEYRCGDFPDGLPLKTGDGVPFLILNGIQTQSARVYCLLQELPALRELGVNLLRVSPHSQNMPEVLAVLRACCDGALSPQEALEDLAPLMPEAPCNGFWHNRAGLEQAYFHPS